MKESENIDKYLDLAGELKKLCNMKVMVKPIAFSPLGMVSKALKKRSGELGIIVKIETIQHF